jgi:hypothetical protein
VDVLAFDFGLKEMLIETVAETAPTSAVHFTNWRWEAQAPARIPDLKRDHVIVDARVSNPQRSGHNAIPFN